ncbi:MAG: ABC transporter, partial [Methanomassiliicoccales archaeon]|nr:ABC transporter [Methanomassiliicoccales archaeon]
FSVDKLPEIARAIINVLPLTPATDCIRCSALGWNFPFTSLILISAYCVVFYLFAHYMIKTGRY